MEKIVRIHVSRANVLTRKNSYANVRTQIFIRDRVRMAKVRMQKFVWVKDSKVKYSSLKCS